PPPDSAPLLQAEIPPRAEIWEGPAKRRRRLKKAQMRGGEGGGIPRRNSHSALASWLRPSARTATYVEWVPPPSPHSRRWAFFSRLLVRAIVGELKGDAQILRFDEGNDGLEIVAALARDAHLLFLDGGLHPDLVVLDEAHDLVGLLLGNAVLA